MTLNSMNTLYVYFIVYAIAQGIMDAYEEAIETPYLKNSNIDLSFIGVMQTIDFLPWCIKFVWALPSDSWNFRGYGHRRPYVVMGLLLAGFAFGGLAFFNPNPPGPSQMSFRALYMFLMITRNIGIAVADCAVDGLSVDAEIDQESGALSGWMSLGRTFGTVLCCVVAGQISLILGETYGKVTGYQYGILASACFVFIPLPANWFIVEEWDDAKVYADKIEEAEAEGKIFLLENGGAASPKVAEGKGLSSSSAPQSPRPLLPGGVSSKTLTEWVDPAVLFAERKAARRPSFMGRIANAVGFDWDLLGELVGQTHVWMFLLYICLTTLGVAIANFSLSAWLEDYHDFRADDIGNIMAVMSVGCFVVSLPLGYLFDLIPYKRSMMFGAAFVCAVCNLALYFCETKAELYWGLFGFGAAHGAIFVVQCSIARILADSRISAVFFGIVNSACNLMHAVGTAITGFIVDHDLLMTPEQRISERAWQLLHAQPNFRLESCEETRNLEPCLTDEQFRERQCPTNFVFYGPGLAPGQNEEFLAAHPNGGCYGALPDYLLSFVVAAAIDFAAVIFVFFISAEKFNLDLSEGGSMRVLPHRKALKLATMRATALNHTAENLKEEGSASKEEVSTTSPLAFEWDSGTTNVFSSPLSSAMASRKAAEAAAAAKMAATARATSSTTLVGGVPMSTPLAEFLAGKGDATAMSAGYYLPAGQNPHPVVPPSASASHALQAIMGADFGVDNKPSARAPRPLPPVDLSSISGASMRRNSSSRGDDFDEKRKRRASAADLEVVPTLMGGDISLATAALTARAGMELPPPAEWRAAVSPGGSTAAAGYSDLTSPRTPTRLGSSRAISPPSPPMSGLGVSSRTAGAPAVPVRRPYDAPSPVVDDWPGSARSKSRHG